MVTEEIGQKLLVFWDGSSETFSGNQSMGSAEKCRHKKGSRDQPGCRQPRTLKMTLVLWACGPYVAKPHLKHHAIRKSAWEETSGHTAGSISETTAKSWASMWRKQTNWRGTGRGGGVMSQGCLNARTRLCCRSNKSVNCGWKKKKDMWNVVSR